MASLDSLVNIIDLKGNMGNFRYDLWQGAAFFVPHPLNTKFTFLVAVMIALILRQIDFSRYRLGCGYTKVVVTQIRLRHNSNI